jgi:hypothetical protein
MSGKGRAVMNKLKSIFCVLFGHSKIVTYCFGYISCARCGDQIGDTLAGVYSLKNDVVVGHKCKECKENYKKLGWKDKLFTPNPFRESK